VNYTSGSPVGDRFQFVSNIISISSYLILISLSQAANSVITQEETYTGYIRDDESSFLLHVPTFTNTHTRLFNIYPVVIFLLERERAGLTIYPFSIE